MNAFWILWLELPETAAYEILPRRFFFFFVKILKRNKKNEWLFASGHLAINNARSIMKSIIKNKKIENFAVRKPRRNLSSSEKINNLLISINFFRSCDDVNKLKNLLNKVRGGGNPFFFVFWNQSRLFLFRPQKQFRLFLIRKNCI